MNIELKDMRSIKYIFTISLIVMVNTRIYPADIKVSGTIKDSQTNEPLPYANIIFTGSGIGTTSDNDGRFTLSNSMGLNKINISTLGYKDTTIIISAESPSNQLDIWLTPTDIMLSDVVVKPKREHYSRKNNPAVDFVKKVIERKEELSIESKEHYSVEQYEKMIVSLDNFDGDGKLFNKFSFLKSHIDTSQINGRQILPLSTKETLTDIYYRRLNHTRKELTKAQREEGIGKDLDESVSYNLNGLFKGINVFDNNIELLHQSFVSPLSSTLATTFYKYYILDTLVINDIPCINLGFVPQNSQSLGFTGNLYITLDGNYSLQKVQMKVPQKINLNFAKELNIEQSFEQLEDGTAVITQEDIYVNIYLFKGLPDVQVHQYKSYKNYDFDTENEVVFDMSDDKLVSEEATNQSEEYWIAHRHVPIRQKESGLKKMLEQLRQLPIYTTIVKVSDAFASGYFLTGLNHETSKFDIGPVLSLVSLNDIEGVRFKVGGMTTANLSEHIFTSGYVAYGIRDQKFKYGAKLTYSFNPKQYHADEYPKNNLSIEHLYDLFAPGDDLYKDKDNFLLSWKTGDPITKMSYIRRTSLSYEKDWSKRFSSKVWLRNQFDTPTGTLSYNISNNGSIQPVPNLTTTELGINLTYTVTGDPYNGRNPTMNLSKPQAILQLSHRAGLKNILGGDYNYQHTELSASTRLKLSAFGYIDSRFTAGKVWTKALFPLLVLPDANQSVIIKPSAFHQMRSYEFIADQYLALDLTYHLNGLIFNRIPFLNLLKLREVVSFNAIYGSLTDKNNPMKTDGLFVLPQGTRPLGSAPYMEMSVGVENIFKILRIDYYRRLNYLEPGSPKGGLRFTLGFTF